MILACFLVVNRRAVAGGVRRASSPWRTSFKV